MKKGLITGITRQDGSYLADLLLEKGYEVYHLAAQSHVRVSFNIPEYTGDVTAVIKLGKQQHLYLGNLAAKPDWGYAPEYIEHAFARVNLDWKDYIKYNARNERPSEVDLLIGDATKAKKQLNWESKVRFPELVKIMVDADLSGNLFTQMKSKTASAINEAATKSFF